LNDEDLLNFTSEGEETVNGVSISAIRWMVEQFYSYVVPGGVYIDAGLDRCGISTPRGRIYLMPEISVEAVQENLSWSKIFIDRQAAVFCVLLHEVGHLALGHVIYNTTVTDAQIEKAETFLDTLPVEWREYHRQITKRVTKRHDDEADQWAVQQFTMLTKKGVFAMLENEVKLQELRTEQERIAEEIGRIEEEQVGREAEIAEERKKVEKTRLEQELRSKSLLWLLADWRRIPTFLNRCFKQLLEMAEEYDTLDTEEKKLYQEVATLQGLLKRAAGEDAVNLIASIRNASQKQAGEPIKLTDELKHFLGCVVSSRERWAVGEASPIRFLDPSRRSPKTDW